MSLAALAASARCPFFPFSLSACSISACDCLPAHCEHIMSWAALAALVRSLLTPAHSVCHCLPVYHEHMMPLPGFVSYVLFLSVIAWLLNHGRAMQCRHAKQSLSVIFNSSPVSVPVAAALCPMAGPCTAYTSPMNDPAASACCSAVHHPLLLLILQLSCCPVLLPGPLRHFCLATACPPGAFLPLCFLPSWGNSAQMPPALLGCFCLLPSCSSSVLLPPALVERLCLLPSWGVLIPALLYTGEEACHCTGTSCQAA